MMGQKKRLLSSCVGLLAVGRRRLGVRSIVTAVVAVWSLFAFFESRAVKRRQALDATSEWSRYAAQPAARGRAIAMMCLRLLPYWFRPTRRRAQESGVILADSLLKLGPLYIKLGQIVSNQENLLPSEWIAALERLQDRVPAKTGQDALELAHAAVGKETFHQLFSSFDTTPLAAASLGQVHRATLRSNGDVVAVKVQRAYLRQIYDRDFRLLSNIATMMDKIFGRRAGSVSYSDIIGDAETILYREIDYRDEADNGIRIANDFGLDKGGQEKTSTAISRDGKPLPSAASWLRIPHVYRNISSEKLLVMEYVPSTKITKPNNNNTKYLANSLARAYLRSLCCHGFFSTDPHAGNLGAESDPPRLVMYDFGQACQLKHDQADGILDVIEAIVDMDPDRCVQAFAKMGVLKENANLEMVRAKVQDNFATGKIRVRNQKKQETAVAEAPKDSEVMKYFTLPAAYAFVARALTQMDGVGKVLDPDFDFISSAAPHIVEIKGTTTYLTDEWTKRWMGVQKKMTEWQQSFEPSSS